MTTTSGSGAYRIDDVHKAVITPAGEVKRTSPRAFELLSFLHSHRGQIISAKNLLKYVWGNEHYDRENVATQVHTLRRDIGPDVVDTIKRHGYGVGIDDRT